MRISRLIIGIAALFIATGAAAKQDKIIICHVGNETGPGGEVYLDDPDCVPEEANRYFCADAGKIDLIVVAKRAKHLNNTSHSWDGISDYEPSEVGANGDGTEDSDGNGIDDGCEPVSPCSCWDTVDLLSVTAENQLDSNSCSAFASEYPDLATIQNIPESTPDVEGGFAAGASPGIGGTCFTRDFEVDMLITVDEARACIAQIAARCAEIGDPIIPD